MLASQQWLDVVSHNLANASTTAFKRDGLAFNDGFVRELYGAGGNLGEMGSGSTIKKAFTNFQAGNVIHTGNPLDVAVMAQRGMFAIDTDQGVRYTRDGAFGLDAARQLVDKAGRPVLDESGSPITVPEGEIEIAADGLVSAGGVEAGRIGVYDGTFSKAGDGLYSSEDAQPVDEPAVRGAALESSNVNAIEEMITMIRLNRAFELAQRSALSQDEITQRLIQSLQDR